MNAEEATMNVYANGVTEWFVAESAEDAAKACSEWNKEMGTGVPDGELDLNFGRVADDKTLTMDFENERGKVTKTAREWADSEPRGFLGSTEY